MFWTKFENSGHCVLLPFNNDKSSWNLWDFFSSLCQFLWSVVLSSLDKRWSKVPSTYFLISLPNLLNVQLARLSKLCCLIFIRNANSCVLTRFTYVRTDRLSLILSRITLGKKCEMTNTFSIYKKDNVVSSFSD